MTSAIILAGGLGTRLRSAVPDLPKPMALINGRPFLEYQLDYWIEQGVERFVLSVGYKRDIIMEHFDKQYRGVAIEYAIEETPLGTGGGFLLAVQILKPAAPFLVINGDTFFNVKLRLLQNTLKSHNAEWVIAMFRADCPDRYGKINSTDEGNIVSFPTEKAKIGEYANGGVYLLSPEILTKFPQLGQKTLSLEQDILPDLLARGMRCYGIPCDGRFIDIGTPEDYARAANILG